MRLHNSTTDTWAPYSLLVSYADNTTLLQPSWLRYNNFFTNKRETEETTPVVRLLELFASACSTSFLRTVLGGISSVDLAFPPSLKVLAASEHVAQDRSRRRRRDRLPAAPPRPRRRGEGVRCVQGHSQDAPPQTQRHEAHRQWRPLRQGVSDDWEGQFLFRTRGAPRFPLEKSGEARAKSGAP